MSNKIRLTPSEVLNLPAMHRSLPKARDKTIGKSFRSRDKLN